MLWWFAMYHILLWRIWISSDVFCIFVQPQGLGRRLRVRPHIDGSCGLRSGKRLSESVLPLVSQDIWDIVLSVLSLNTTVIINIILICGCSGCGAEGWGLGLGAGVGPHEVSCHLHRTLRELWILWRVQIEMFVSSRPHTAVLPCFWDLLGKCLCHTKPTTASQASPRFQQASVAPWSLKVSQRRRGFAPTNRNLGIEVAPQN